MSTPIPTGQQYALPDGRLGDPDWEITPLQVQAMQGVDAESLVILDVREPAELATAALPEGAGVLHVPMGEIKARLGEIEAAADGKHLVAMCHLGGRSLQVAVFLRKEAEMEDVRSMAGGIDAWAVQIDSAIARY
ncbi:MAG: rhodanese-like domain-containing protein [Planctomycetota bacterium]